MGKEKLALAFILILGLGLRLWGANQSFWLDEASQAQQSVLAFSQIWSGRAGDFHPPLFYLLAHVWLTYSHSEVWARLLPIGIGLIGIWLMTPLSNYIFSNKKIKVASLSLSCGTWASLLLAINPFHIYYSQEFRMYSLLATLGIWAMYLFAKSSRWLWLPLVLMLYTHYASFLLLPTMLGYALVFDRTKLKSGLAHWGLALLGYTPWLPQFLRQLGSGVNIDQYLPGWRELLTLGPVTATPLVLFKLMAGRINFISRIAYGIYAGFVLGLIGAAIVIDKVKRPLLLSWLFLPLLAAIGLSFVIPLTQPFRLIFVLPALILLLVGAMLRRFPQLILLLVVYISVTGIVMYASRPRLQREQWRQASQYLQSQVGPNSAVVIKFSGNFAPLDWYAPQLEVTAAVPTY
ncbi:MAG: hypothetical protein Q7S31_03510, partial [bacterium]|nr:hypothetical protein [bacterium]